MRPSTASLPHDHPTVIPDKVFGRHTGYARDFIGYWLDRLIFYNAPPWVFTAVYLTFGMLVLLTLWFIPVRRPHF